MKLRIKDFKNKIEQSQNYQYFLVLRRVCQMHMSFAFLQSYYELVEYLETFKSSKRVRKVKTS